MRFGSPMFVPEPFCKSASKSKVSIVIHSDYGLTGGCWGNGLPGMWIGPGATADHWGLAHEFTHAWPVQRGHRAQLRQSNTCGWIFESHANWSAQQLPEYHTSNVHCSEMLGNAPHLYPGSTRDPLLQLAVHGVPEGQVLLPGGQRHLAQLSPPGTTPSRTS